MTKKVFSQTIDMNEGSNHFTVKSVKDTEGYLDYDIEKMAQTVSNISGKEVQITVTEVYIFTPEKSEES